MSTYSLKYKKEVVQFMKDYGARLRARRKELGMLQYEVAEAVGVSQSVISFMENGYMIPPSDIELAILELLYG